MKIYENILKKLIKARVVNKRFSWQSSHLLSTNDSHMTASGWINIVYSTLITIALKNRYTNFFLHIELGELLFEISSYFKFATISISSKDQRAGSSHSSEDPDKILIHYHSDTWMFHRCCYFIPSLN